MRQLNNEYRLSNRRFRQLSPLGDKSTGNPPATTENTTEGYINHAYSTNSLYDQLANADSAPSAPDLTLQSQLPVADSTPAVPSSSTATATTTDLSNSRIPNQTMKESFHHMCSLICKLMKNTRYVCIIIANLFEGILIKGKLFILLYLIKMSFSRICPIYHQIFSISTSIGYIHRYISNWCNCITFSYYRLSNRCLFYE